MRLHVPVSLRWSDIDAYAHVNNAAMLRLLEEVRIEAFWVTGESIDSTDGVGPRVLDGSPGADTLSLIARQEIEYLRPIPYQRTPLDAEVWIGRMGGASLELGYEIYSTAGVEPRVLYTKAATTLVLANASDSKPRRMTDREREALAPYVDEPVVFSKRR
ncbi:thioesterase family protein [Amnibacterium sp. CER49]|uniref:acyl-CoA thioesterase n=1 Tax=Amnibacterium sp. CER49 TaxID=3039161 RepID=UPI002449645B|nr:thioesterase family protein [Amnibacterium sp. CER49]MDH2442550.1 thioesterase family protein [Amnibacterium sp. CER49]